MRKSMFIIAAFCAGALAADADPAACRDHLLSDAVRLEACEEAIRTNPNDAEAYVFRGSLRHLKGDLRGAEADYTRAIKIDPKREVFYFGRGQAYDDLCMAALSGQVPGIKRDPEAAARYRELALQDYMRAFADKGFGKPRPGEKRESLLKCS